MAGKCSKIWVNTFGTGDIAHSDHDLDDARGWSQNEDLGDGKLSGWSASPAPEKGPKGGNARIKTVKSQN